MADWARRALWEALMRRSSLIIFVVAIGLGLLAVGLLRMAMVRSGDGGSRVASRAESVPVVVAAADIAFGEPVSATKLKVVDWPRALLPAGAFRSLDDVHLSEGRTAIRAIAANEIVTPAALVTGANRLSTAPLLSPNMRAVSVPVNEVAGVGGLIYPGDRVDVMFTRQAPDAMPYGELLLQDAQVLAVGLDMNVAKDKPQVVRSATLEVTPAQAQKVALAMATGQLSLALRHFSDDSRVELGTVQVTQLADGGVSRVLARARGADAPSQTAANDALPPAPARRRGGQGPSAGSAPTVVVMRGTEAATVPLGSSAS